MHRDVKPANILITKSGYAKLADFGLAKLDALVSADDVDRAPCRSRRALVWSSGRSRTCRRSKPLDTPVDTRSDIFSFGLVLYELLAGRRAFTGTSDVDTLHAIVHDAPGPLPARVPVGLRLLVEKALEKDPAERFQSMRELVVDLRREARRPSESAGHAQVADAPRRGSRGWVIAIALVSTAMLAARVDLGAIPWIASERTRAENPLANARFTTLTDFAGDELDAAISPDGRFVAFVSDRDGRFDVWLSQIGSGEPSGI